MKLVLGACSDTNMEMEGKGEGGRGSGGEETSSCCMMKGQRISKK